MALTTPPSANADSYISLTDANTYFSSTLKEESWTAYTTAQKEAALRLATRHLDAEDWKGERSYTREANSLRLPRRNLYDRDGELISSTVVPPEIQIATCELALEMLDVNLGEGDPQVLEKLEVGSIALTYGGTTTNSARYQTRYPGIVQALIAPYLLPTRFGSVATLVRA